MVDIPAPEPEALLKHWMEWEKGDTTPGEVLKNLKKSGMKETLTALVEGSAGSEGAA